QELRLLIQSPALNPRYESPVPSFTGSGLRCADILAAHHAVNTERRPMPGPLADLRILDLGWAMAGPQATRILADFGADVIKVESRARLDLGRTLFGPHVGERSTDNSGYFNNFNRNKRSATINMSRPEAREIFARLVTMSDAVLENFSAGVMENWGLDYDGLCRLRPDIVYVSMAGLGHSGPYRDYQTFGPTVQALSGLTHLSGFPDMQ